MPRFAFLAASSTIPAVITRLASSFSIALKAAFLRVSAMSLFSEVDVVGLSNVRSASS